MTVRAIEWDPATDRLRLLDQTKLPGESVHLDIKSVDALVDAIAQHYESREPCAAGVVQ